MTTYTLFIEEVITRQSDVEIEADSLDEAIEKFEGNSGWYLGESETYSGDMWEYETDELCYVDRAVWENDDGMDETVILAGKLEIKLHDLPDNQNA